VFTGAPPRRSLAALLAALAAVALLAGCGAGGKSSSSGHAPAAPSSSSTQATAAGTAPSTSTSTSSSSAAVGRALFACRALISSAPHLTAALKSKAEGICNKTSSGDVAGARKAAREVCAQIVGAARVSPEAKERARASCSRL
jgi:hypothetical protein